MSESYIKVDDKFYKVAGDLVSFAEKLPIYRNKQDLLDCLNKVNTLVNPPKDLKEYIRVYSDGSTGYIVDGVLRMLVHTGKDFTSPNGYFFNLKKEEEKQMREPNSTTFLVNGVYVIVADEKPSVVLPKVRNSSKEHLLSALVNLYSSRVKLGTRFMVKPNSYFEVLNGSIYHNGRRFAYSYGVTADVVAALFEQNQYVDKIVRFKYDGGTNPGERRIVKVTSEDNFSIYGTDVHKGEERKYLKNKIQGVVEIL